MPPHWRVYVRVASADAAALRAKELGGTVVAAPIDVGDAGRMAVLQDPTGAVLAVWEAKRNIGLGVVDEPGAFCWAELMAKDPARSATFYKPLFGWGTKDDPRYVEWTLGGRSIGGMIEIRKDWGEMPPHWLVYFQVEGCDTSVDEAKSLGGKLLDGAARLSRRGPHRPPAGPARGRLLSDRADRRRPLSHRLASAPAGRSRAPHSFRSATVGSTREGAPGGLRAREERGRAEQQRDADEHERVARGLRRTSRPDDEAGHQ